MSPRDSDRKTLLADAAIEVVGDDGLRGLTHRAVEERAGLPSGTCSYHFPTRAALIEAILDRIAALDRGDIERLIDGQPLQEMELATLVEACTAVLAIWLGPGRARSRTRLLLMLDPQSRRLAGPVSERLAAGFHALATALARDADRGRVLMAVIDGLVVDELTRGTTPVDVDRLRFRVAAVAKLVLP
ncbi:Transcriptional regulator, TetR family [Alloactinosynnema sp. L-07]|uniref:TetR/AcrR family transcriptional regulator n=1 Tax=Alloactinosynnema sp. L-07 TaxID=1653480 RepID=UPI00065F0AD4|nr:TetR family transcriptional regulator [Alloactinosynnema sp. L-07]CRK60848.1 Transcriptional regulator, TetR family [Alloactinosynnema sp. L-07]